jgi:DNA polymerase III alpha subunit
VDIDLDTSGDFDPLTLFPWVKASLVRAVDPVTKVSAIPYKNAEDLGYMKIDFLHNHVYDSFVSRKEIDEMLDKDPDWGILLIPSEQKKLFQLANHGDVLTAVKPRSVEELADVLALIRPGKRSLLKLYLAQRSATRKILYSPDSGGYFFKKSHSISYALVVTLQLHQIEAGKL